eukprot:9929770-Alexandrium_andersonii.AAC.1
MGKHVSLRKFVSWLGGTIGSVATQWRSALVSAVAHANDLHGQEGPPQDGSPPPPQQLVSQSEPPL